MKQGLSLLLSLGCFTLNQGLFLQVAKAQVTPDGTTNTTIDISGNDFTIENGDRAGDNLFHSFSEFSVPTDGSAFFNNAADIVNIFSRVTGGNISNIDGLLGANGTANLFLINPAGIIFGEGARLDIGGSFYGSTADSIVFSDGEFSATDLANPPLLTINAPIGLNFRDNPGDIVNRSNLSETTVRGEGTEFEFTEINRIGLVVDQGKDLALIGGNISMENSGLTARGGNIELGGLSSSGTVAFNEDGSLSFPDDVAKADITLKNGSNVDVRSTGGGNITINARNLSVDDISFDGSTSRSGIRAGITIDSFSPSAQAGNIIINASDSISIEGANSFAPIFSTLTAISNEVEGTGNGGNITINATNSVSLNGGEISSDIIRREGVGNGGDITITTGNLSLKNAGGDIAARVFGQGNGGSIDITASDIIILVVMDLQAMAEILLLPRTLYL